MIDPIVVSPAAARAPRLHQGMSATDAAREFETMLIAAWMKTAREAGEINEKEDEMTGADSYIEFAEKYVAEAIAGSHAFGFTEVISAELERRSAPTQEPGPPAKVRAAEVRPR